MELGEKMSDLDCNPYMWLVPPILYQICDKQEEHWEDQLLK
jgi:hypothetical protein